MTSRWGLRGPKGRTLVLGDGRLRKRRDRLRFPPWSMPWRETDKSHKRLVPNVRKGITMKTTPHKTIQDIVFHIIRQTKGFVSYEAVTRAVLQRFPHSKWKKSHWAYYRTHITSDTGRYRDAFSEEIRANLQRTAKPARPAPDDSIKRIGDRILDDVRSGIKLAAKDNTRMRFKLRRWVYGRLMQEEIREKRPIKKALWDSGVKACQGCGEEFDTIKGVEIHRKNGDEPYSVENCQLLCRKCHQKTTQ